MSIIYSLKGWVSVDMLQRLLGLQSNAEWQAVECFWITVRIRRQKNKNGKEMMKGVEDFTHTPTAAVRM